ncbi:hypothetical protein GCM10009665_46510 [Kitasatospora nipponensis]|uniref:DNA (cytosine-5-)-methyltransferase n=1 Tax=Kitasatospora nipponensis TaxID=258049 RepID=A0ABN1WJD1_9ACTN
MTVATVCGPGGIPGPQAPTAALGTPLRIGSVCTGTAALDLAVETVLPARLAWCADNDPAAARLLAHHFPHVPNLGDLTTVDWHTVEPVDIVTAGFPCQDISYAGRGAGLTEGTRSGLWHTIAHAIRILRPRLVFVENVTALRRRGLDTVAADLASSGYDLAWRCLRASDIGAPHRRDRLFLLGSLRDPAFGDTHSLRLHRPEPHPADRTRLQPAHPSRPRPGGTRHPHRTAPEAAWADHHRASSTALQPRCVHSTPADSAGRRRCQGQPTPTRLQGRPHPPGHRRLHQPDELPATPFLTPGHTNWGEYERAIRRWERTLGRPAPPPTCRGRAGAAVLSPDFVEWMMGIPDGWTDGLGLSGTARIRLCGNSVVPQQAARAVHLLFRQLADSESLP